MTSHYLNAGLIGKAIKKARIFAVSNFVLLKKSYYDEEKEGKTDLELLQYFSKPQEAEYVNPPMLITIKNDRKVTQGVLEV